VKTRLTEQFGIRHPMLSAPMALVAGGRLVAAVSDAGGLGILGGGYAGALGGEPDLAQELRLVEGRTFGVRFITWALDRAPQALDEVLKRSPYCVFLSFGDPQPFARPRFMTPRPSWSAKCKPCGMWTKRSMPEPTPSWHRARKLAATERPARRCLLSPKSRIIWRSVRQRRCCLRREELPMAEGLLPL